MTATIERYFAPASLDEAAVMMAAGDATVLAGGTDLMPQTNAGRMRFGRTLVNIRHVPELGGIGQSSSHVQCVLETLSGGGWRADLSRRDLRALLLQS